MNVNSISNKLELNRDPLKNIVTISNVDRYLADLENGEGGGKGANSYVFRVIDLAGDEEEQVIKICRYFTPTSNPTFQRRIRRFEREIRALKKAIDEGKHDFLIQLYDEGNLTIDNKTFRFFTMEKADYDLRKFLIDASLSIQQKVLLCNQLLKALQALHSLDIYHRDLKPDNILFVGERWKIADLGLVQFRNEDFELDAVNERIGPFGYFSPEATNKALGNKDLPEFAFDCVIDHKSDLFQLGKIFWYILQGEVPTGQLAWEDFKAPDQQDLYQEVILPLLQYSKSRRPEIAELEVSLEPIRERLAI